MISSDADSIVTNLRLRTTLRDARADAKLSQGAVGKALDWSAKRVFRLETGESPISADDIQAMASLYGINRARTQELLNLAEAASGPAWWSPFQRVISPEFGLFLSFERAATQLCSFHPTLVHGLLQTQDYAHELLSRTSTPLQLVSRKRLRLARRDVFRRAEPPEVTILLGEAALRNRVGSAEIMQEQLLDLRRFATEGPVDLGVVPFDNSIYPAMLIGFDLARLSDTEVSLFLESPPGSRTTKDETTLNELFGDFFGQIRARALFGLDAVALITAILEKQARADSGKDGQQASSDHATEAQDGRRGETGSDSA